MKTEQPIRGKKHFIGAGIVALTSIALGVAFPNPSTKQNSIEQNNPTYQSASLIPNSNLDYKKENPRGYQVRENPADSSLLVKINPDSVDNGTLLASLIYLEGCNCSKSEKTAIGYSVLNRQRIGGKYGLTLKDVMLKNKAYSCFNWFNNNQSKDIRLKIGKVERKLGRWEESLDVANCVLSGQCPDPSNGATHYFNPNKVNPYWKNDSNLIRLGRINNSKHLFFKEI